MAAEDAVRKELLSEFKDFADDIAFLDSCAKIGALLSGGYGKGTITNALNKLETAMFKVIDDRLTPQARMGMDEKMRQASMSNAANAGAFTSKTKGAGKAIGDQTSTLTTTGTNPFKKVLVTALVDFERNLGYPVNQDENFHPSYVGLVSGKDFLGNIGKGAHWKDVGASPDHGEFTHRLQWFTIAASEKVPANTVGAVYRQIGLCGFKASNPDGFGQTDLWARLFDRPLQRLSKGLTGAAESNDDYRCPEHFNTYLRGAAKTFPLLSGFLAARHAKRALGDSDAFPSKALMQDYCAKKMFKSTTYALLSLPQQREEVDKVIDSGMLVL